MISRRNVLIALAQADLLTDERQLAIRVAFERDIPRLLLDWQVPPAVLAAANTPPLVPHSLPPPDDDTTIQQAVDLHMAILGIAAVPTRVVSLREAHVRPYDAEWLAALRRDEPDLYTAAYGHFPPNIARIIHKHADPAWAPLADLIVHSVDPYGLAQDRSHFRIVFPETTT